MNDPSIPAGLAKRLYELAGKWATSASHVIENDVGSTLDQCADELRALLPAPTPPTLADMTPEERRACQWMQADVAYRVVRYVIANPYDDDDEVALIAADGDICWVSPERVTPRPDLPRLEWPGNTKPDTSLPEGWKLADHPDYGRVIVTRPEPYADGSVGFVHRTDFINSGHGTDWCKPDALTFIDSPTTKEDD